MLLVVVVVVVVGDLAFHNGVGTSHGTLPIRETLVRISSRNSRFQVVKVFKISRIPNLNMFKNSRLQDFDVFKI